MSGQGYHGQRSWHAAALAGVIRRPWQAEHQQEAGLKGVPESLWQEDCYGAASVARKKRRCRNGDNMQDQKKLLMSAERVMVLVFAPLGSDAGR